jgi:hypothetical protein
MDPYGGSLHCGVAKSLADPIMTPRPIDSIFYFEEAAP